MRCSPFFPRRLDPILDRGERHEDPVVSPKVPTGRAIGHAVLDHQADRPLLHAVGVMALGQGQVIHVGVETPPARGALMGGVGYVNVQGPAATVVAQVVQDAMRLAAATSLPAAVGTLPPSIIPASPFDSGWRQILHPRDPLGGIRNVVTRSVHDRFSRRSASGDNIGQSAPTTPGICNNDATVSSFVALSK